MNHAPTSPMTVPTSPFERLRGLISRHPVAAFLLIAFALAYPLMALVVLAQHGVLPGAAVPARLGFDLEEAASLMMLLLGLLPAALAITAMEGGRAAVGALFRRILRWRFAPGWWLVVTLALPVSTIAVALLLGDQLRVPRVTVLFQELGALVGAFLLINIWEETAWAGFLQTRLEREHSFFVAALLTAIPFAAIHLPLRVINGETTARQLALSFVALTAFGFVFRSLLGLVVRGTRGSVLAAGLLHTLFNRSNNGDGIAADLLVGPNRQTAALVASLLLTIVLGTLSRRRLGRVRAP